MAGRPPSVKRLACGLPRNQPLAGRLVAAMGKWRVPAVVADLIEQTERQEIEPAEIGRTLGVRHSTKPDAERQSFYDVRDGTKRIWLHDAERWAERIGARLTLRFDDPWSQLESAINALPPGDGGLKRSLRALTREHRPPAQASPPSKRRRAAGES